MTITKYEHACLDIALDGNRLIIDPGVYTDFSNYEGITAVVITHMHQDHYDETKIEKILATNTNVQIFAPEDLASQLAQKINVQTVRNGYSHKVGSFNLEFFGEQHAYIEENVPVCQNTALLVNNALYYPGDSLTTCPKPYSVLAVPTMAPWLKYSEIIPLITDSPAEKVFSTHNGFINEEGQSLYNRLFDGICTRNNKQYKYLKPNDSIEILA